MRIAFVLPAPIRVPIGGAAVVYRHAEGLAARGHQVRVIAPRALSRRGGVRALAVAVRDRLHGVRDAPYYRAEGVTTEEPARLEASTLMDDAVIATGVQTVPDVLGAPGRGWWFVQGDETYVEPDARDSWRRGLRHIACSGWLADEVRAFGGEVAGVAPNAVDREVFGADVAPHERAPSVLALYHRHPSKGPDVLIETLRQVRAARSDARLTVFCARRPSHRMPPGVEVVVRPSPARLRTLYNQAAVFLHTSTTEGWALTPMEAAYCGAAVVATDSRGPSEYLRDGTSMVLHAVGDADGLARSALDLLAEGSRRGALARAGMEATRAYSWERSTDRFEAILLAGAAP